MKKAFALLVVVFLGYIVLQNWSIWMLKILSLSSQSGPNVQAKPVANLTPPYKDGSYTGSVADAFYGNIQVKATISGGKIADVQFLQYPNDRSRSIVINTAAMPLLKQEAIQSQTSNVDVVSGATDSSQAFVQSLQSALSQAK